MPPPQKDCLEASTRSVWTKPKRLRAGRPENSKETGLHSTLPMRRESKSDGVFGRLRKPLFIHHAYIIVVFMDPPQEFGEKGDECREKIADLCPREEAIGVFCPAGS